MNMMARVRRYIARHIIPYFDWALTLYSVFAFRCTIRGFVKTTPGPNQNNPINIFFHNQKIFEALTSHFENETVANFFEVFFGILVVGNTWILIVELMAAWRFYRARTLRETWSSRAELKWYEKRRSDSAKFGMTEGIFNYVLGSFLHGIVTILMRFVVLTVVTLHIKELRVTIQTKKKRDKNGSSLPRNRRRNNN